MELNLMLAQERRRQLQLLIELAKLKQARAPRAEQLGEVIDCRKYTEPAARSLAAGKATVSESVLRTERECAASSEPEKQMPGVLLTTQAAGRSEVPCSDVVTGDSPDTAPLCSQCVENETHATLTATRTAGLEAELGSDLTAEANARGDDQEASKWQGSCTSFDTLSNNGCGDEVTVIASSPSAGEVVETSLVERLRRGNYDAHRVSGAHSVASLLEPVDTAVATPVAVAWELPDSNKVPRGELAQIGSSVATEAEASTDRLEARTLRRGLSQAHYGEDSPHTFEAHPLQSNFCWRRPAEETGGPSRVSTATELTRGGRLMLATSASLTCSGSGSRVPWEDPISLPPLTISAQESFDFLFLCWPMLELDGALETERLLDLALDLNLPLDLDLPLDFQRGPESPGLTGGVELLDPELPGAPDWPAAAGSCYIHVSLDMVTTWSTPAAALQPPPAYKLHEQLKGSLLVERRLDVQRCSCLLHNDGQKLTSRNVGGIIDWRFSGDLVLRDDDDLF
ncbi:hypothetical protein HPB50_012014 [Hyalomma asiaticum]|uniref:Uncharacterized protein n=1 Tax=Hyalomma asiaticum TaxID=266040 RepID=A0ACB7RQY5_HYAAI|nr:hypothetical protein HPB50_012014 [Hyalomma asiaticum]